MKDLSQMTASELEFYNFLVEDSKNWWPCEIEDFKAVYKDVDYLDWLFEHYTSMPCFEDVWRYRYEEEKRDSFWSLLEMEQITLKDGIDEDEALNEYLKGPSGKFLDLINEDTW